MAAIRIRRAVALPTKSWRLDADLLERRIFPDRDGEAQRCRDLATLGTLWGLDRVGYVVDERLETTP